MLLRVLGCWTAFCPVVASAAEFVPEPTGQVATLPATYPDHWLIVHDLAFNHMREGKFFIVDPAGDGIGGQVKGILSGDFIASYLHSAKRNEHYVIETFHARGGRGGERTDVVTIYDPGTLEVLDEVIIPPKRLTGLPNRYQVALIGDDRWLVVYNFTPAQSVSVVDLESRSFAAEIAIPGCAFVFPTGNRAFSSLCSDGGLRTTVLDGAGGVASVSRLPPFIDIEADAAFAKPAYSGGTAYFPTFTGNVIPVDLSTDQPTLGQSWSLTTDAERALGWRPGGVWPAVADNAGRLFVLMHSNGAEGTHKEGGEEVWVFNPAERRRVNRFTLENWGVSLGMSGGSPAMLVVTNAEMGIDLYTTDGDHTGELAIQASTPLIVHGMN